MHFVVYALDRPDMTDVRMRVRPAHRARLREHDHPLKVMIAGAMLDDAGAMIGSMLVVEAETREAVEAFVAGDPYVRNGVYGKTEIRPFAWGMGVPAAG